MGEAERREADVVIVGAGIAGASVGYELARTRSVIMIEQESHAGYHTTGRSAAIYTRTYGPPPIRALSRASAGFFADPGDGFAEHPLLTPRGVMFIARQDQISTLDAVLEESVRPDAFERLTGESARERLPSLRPDYIGGALYEAEARDIDVHGLHQGYLAGFARRGGTFRPRCRLIGLEHSADGWRIETDRGEFRAPVVVNAAGAWADEVAALAGIRPVGLTPKRRTAMIVAGPDGVDASEWPMTVDVDEQFYLKPDAGKLLISPADETPSPPCDAQPEDLDVAIAVDRIVTAFDLAIPRIEHKWAGLRSFVADKAPAVGFDSRQTGFFWLAGQGGYGIQSAPALARLAAALLRGEDMPEDIAAEGLDLADVAPDRPGLAA